MKNTVSSAPRGLLPTALVGAVLAALTPLHAVDFTEEFDGAALNTGAWISTGGKTVTVAGGSLTWEADGGNWASGDLSTVQQFFLPAAGEMAVIEWTLGPNSITTQNPNGTSSIRQQIGIVSANETGARREHWTNTTGGLWLDLDNMALANPNGVGGGIYTANDTKVANAQGTTVAGVTIPDWNWATASHVFRLEFTDSAFTWYNGTGILGSGTWAAAGIDTEFGNGFRVLALGMNFDAGRGTTAVQRIAVTNTGSPPSLITSFSTSLVAPVSREYLTLAWVVEPGASLSIDQGIGNVDAVTVAGRGRLVIEAPVVAVATGLPFTLTATRDAESATRTLTLNVQPAPEPFLDDLLDHFDGDTLNSEHWEHRGDRTYTLANSRINWNADGTNWSHGEVDSVPVFPMPEPGKPTTIIWTLGPAAVAVPGPNGNSLRPMIGIFSSFERNTWSRQHWQNITGGVWLDITTMGDNRPGGVSGNMYFANDRKPSETNATDLGGFDVADWTWRTDAHSFSLVVTDQDYTWYSGETLLNSGTWEAAGLDHEFVNGFKIMMMAGNFDFGRGPQSLDAIQVINGSALVAPFRITSIVRDAGTGEITLTWNSERNAGYALDFSSDLASWPEVVDGIPADGSSTSYTHLPEEGQDYFRIRKE